MASNADFDFEVKDVDDVLITSELSTRPSRSPDYEREAKALEFLAQEMVTNPRGVLRRCAELVMELCHADSAGISILEPGGTNGILRWHAAAGAFAPHLHGTMPREASPCGTVMERNCVLLFSQAERFFPSLRGVEPRIYENLLAPWHAKEEAIGTLWAIKHSSEGRFDREDARVIQSLARVAAAAFQMVSALDEATAKRTESEQRTEALHAAEAQLTVLVAELQHRTRNIVGVVRAIAAQTLAESDTLEEFESEFGHRLDALLRVQRLFSRSIEDPITMGELVHLELEALGASLGERLEIQGPVVPLQNSSVQVLSLALHELATNARKYGALAYEGGRLSIRWMVHPHDGQERRLYLEWIESHVPNMPAPGAAPAGSGYGRQLIEKALPYQLGAETTYELGLDGVHCRISLPVDNADRGVQHAGCAQPSQH